MPTQAALAQTRPAAFSNLEIRPLDPDDREDLAAAYERLSERSRYDRFLGPKPVISEIELDRLTRLDHISRDAIAAIDKSTGEIVGVARYAAQAGNASTAEIAVFVADDWQGRGLGFALTRLLAWRAMTTGFTCLIASVFEDNARSLGLLRKLGFTAHSRDANVLELRLQLRRA